MRAVVLGYVRDSTKSAGVRPPDPINNPIDFMCKTFVESGQAMTSEETAEQLSKLFVDSVKELVTDLYDCCLVRTILHQLIAIHPFYMVLMTQTCRFGQLFPHMRTKKLCGPIFLHLKSLQTSELRALAAHNYFSSATQKQFCVNDHFVRSPDCEDVLFEAKLVAFSYFYENLLYLLCE